jgi:hypothetical protein
MHLIIIAAILVIAFILFKTTKSNRKDSLDIKKERLVRKCNGDRDRAERMVVLELKKNRGMSLEKAIENALHFFERDS